MDKVPHRAVIHREAPFAQLGHQAAQCEGPLAAARDQPEAVLASDLARLVTAHLARPKAASLAPPPDPSWWYPGHTIFVIYIGPMGRK